PLPEYFLNRMILASRNVDVFQINDTVLDKMSGNSRTFISADKVIEEPGAVNDDNDHPIPVELLRPINSGSLPSGELSIK
ncbi:hypothetical protein GGX14DRAFT_319684, partial [Mycena pura]